MPVKITVKMNFSAAGAAAKIRSSVAEAMPDLTRQIQSDCNNYAPDRKHTLIEQSNIISSTDEMSTEIRWGVPYANYVYEGVSKKGKPLKYSRDKNPNAQKKWCKAAKKDHSDEWRLKLEKTAKENYKK